MKGLKIMELEINMIVNDAKKAADFYKKLFGAQILSITDLDRGLNETMMVIAETKIRILDENPDFGLIGPSDITPVSMGINLFVDDRYELAKTAEQLGCVFVMPITEYTEQNAINTVFKDIFSHTWVVNQMIN